MPLRIHPRPYRVIRRRISAALFFAEIAAKAFVATAFLAVLSLTPAA